MSLGTECTLRSEKKCGRCQKTKPTDAFSLCKSRGDGLHTRCKQCCSEHYQSRRDAAIATMKAYWEANRDELLEKQRYNWHENREARLNKQREYRDKNREAIRQQQLEYRRKNPELISARNRNQYLKNKASRNDYSKRWNSEQRKSDPLFRLKSNLRTRTNGAIRRGGYTKLSGLNESIGCDWPTLKDHLSSHFTREMTWENYGSYWVVDHHIPLASAASSEEIVALCHYTNLRPLEKAENLRKGASMPRAVGES